MSKAIDSLTSGKTPGSDGITAVILKCRKPALLNKLHKLLCLCWSEGAVLQGMGDATIVTLYKNKGDRSDRKDHHGISLLGTIGKLFVRVVLTDSRFLRKRSTQNHRQGSEQEDPRPI